MARYSTLALLVVIFCGACQEDVYHIDEKSFTVFDESAQRRYVDVEAIDQLPEQKLTLLVATQDTLFLRGNHELKLKSGWTLRGETGKEIIIKERSSTTSAIRIKQADRVSLRNLNIIAAKPYTPARGQALVLIENSFVHKRGILLKDLTLAGHYSGITVRKGQNVSIQDCLLEANSHQIYLGELDTARGPLKDFWVDDVEILRTRILRSQIDTSFGNDGIKTRSNCTNIRIADCYIEDNWGDAIDLYPGGVDVTISGNKLSNNRVHGVEVKMNSSVFKPEDTGQIRNVVIDGNTIARNDDSGVRLIDNPGDHYVRGIQILRNQIDSNMRYGIHANLPVTIKENHLSWNGLVAPDRVNTTFAGIYLLNVVRPGVVEVSNNHVFDQAPIPTPADQANWINLNNVKVPFMLRNNRLVVTSDYPDTVTKNRYGINIFYIGVPVEVESVRANNRCVGDFKDCVFGKDNP